MAFVVVFLLVVLLYLVYLFLHSRTGDYISGGSKGGAFDTSAKIHSYDDDDNKQERRDDGNHSVGKDKIGHSDSKHKHGEQEVLEIDGDPAYAETQQVDARGNSSTPKSRKVSIVSIDCRKNVSSTKIFQDNRSISFKKILSFSPRFIKKGKGRYSKIDDEEMNVDHPEQTEEEYVGVKMSDSRLEEEGVELFEVEL